MTPSTPPTLRLDPTGLPAWTLETVGYTHGLNVCDYCAEDVLPQEPVLRARPPGYDPDAETWSEDPDRLQPGLFHLRCALAWGAALQSAVSTGLRALEAAGRLTFERDAATPGGPLTARLTGAEEPPDA